jgi:hypothetical protein
MIATDKLKSGKRLTFFFTGRQKSGAGDRHVHGGCTAIGVPQLDGQAGNKKLAF